MRERVIRVFVSSTFRDMHAERDHLVKFVFPELRKLCERRSVTWAEVDLRWGITDEQAAEGKLLPICIEEVHRCQPYFIGLLGERYGAVPRNMPAQLVKEQPWLQEHCGCSLTELEMIHGVLREPRVPGPALFYFRDRAYLEHLPEGASRSDFEAEDDQACEKLASLKQRIRRAQQEQACGLRENYRDPEELGQWILTDFTHLIDELFPEDQQPGVLDQESAGHESFARSRRGVYIGRPEYFRLLDAHAANQELPLVLYGESGSGKSALLANWGARYCAANPEVFVLMHFIGATGSSSDRAEMLRRLMGEIKRRFQITGEIPDRVEDLAVAFVNWLHIAAAQGPMILILDGLNQLEDRDGALELVWLPPVIPSNVRMFLSTLPGRPLDELQKRGWPTFEIKLLDRAERMQLLEQYLAQYTKALERPRAEAIVAAPQTANPLYLRALLNELRVFGEYEGLNDRILYYLEAGNVRALYQKILRRWEADYDGGTNLVRRASTLIWAARRGLAESELFDLLGAAHSPLPRATWSPFYLAAEQALINRSGILNFGHEYLREAVRETYLPRLEDEQAVHRALANYFYEAEVCPRKIDELPWQLAELNDWQMLSELLADRRFFPRAWDQNNFEVQRYWVRIEASSSLRMLDAYTAEINFSEILQEGAFGPRSGLIRQFADVGRNEVVLDPGGLRTTVSVDEYFLDAVALLLAAAGHAVEAVRIRAPLIESYKDGSDPAGLQLELGGQAALLIQLGDLDAASQALKRQELICREIGDKEALRRCLGSQGLIHCERGELDAAMALHQEQERMARDVGGWKQVGIALHNQALVWMQKTEPERALELYKEEERICRRLADLEGLQLSLGGQADAIAATGHFDGVMKLYKEQENICRELGDRIGMVLSLGNQAVLLRKLTNFNGALRAHKEEERLCRETGYRKGLAVSLGNQALLLKEIGKPSDALKLMQEQEAICRDSNLLPVLQSCLANQATIFFDRGDYGRALMLAQESESILRQVGPLVKLAAWLGQKANILKKLSRIDEVRTALKEQEQMCQELGDPGFVAGALMNQAMLLEDRNERRVVLEKARNIISRHGLESLTRRFDELEDALRSENVIP